MPSQNKICGVKFGRFWTFEPPGGRLEFCDILSKSNERDPNPKPYCDLWGQISSILVVLRYFWHAHPRIFL